MILGYASNVNYSTIKNVVINVDSNFLVQAGVLARQLCKFTEIEAVHVLMFGCTKNSESEILELTKDLTVSFYFYHIDEVLQEFSNLSENRGVTLISYGKLIIAKVLPKNIHTVLFLDCDILIRNDLSKILNKKFDTPIAAVIQKPIKIHSLGKVFDYYFNAGVLLLNLKQWRDEDVDSRVFRVFREFGPFEYMDQDVLNIIFENNFTALPQEFNYFSESAIRRESKTKAATIVHFAGPFKPWLNPYRSKFHHEWIIWYLKSLGGSFASTRISYLKFYSNFFSNKIVLRSIRKIRRLFSK